MTIRRMLRSVRTRRKRCLIKIFIIFHVINFINILIFILNEFFLTVVPIEEKHVIDLTDYVRKQVFSKTNRTAV